VQYLPRFIKDPQAYLNSEKLVLKQQESG